MRLDCEDGELLLSGCEQLCEFPGPCCEIEDAGPIDAIDACSLQESSNRFRRIGGPVLVVKSGVSEATGGSLAQVSGSHGSEA